jgi:hypothetical protein
MLGFRRALVVAVLALAAVGFTAATAPAGANPNRTPFLGPDQVGPFCGPAIGVVVEHATVDREYYKTYVLQDGTIKFLVNGSLTLDISGNGHTVTINAGGPGAEYLRPDGSILVTGFGQVVFTGIHGEGIWLYNGNVAVDGNTGLIISRTGHATDICAMLS